MKQHETVNKGGRPPVTVNEAEFKKACQEWHRGMLTAKEIQESFRISPSTFYRITKSYGLQKRKAQGEDRLKRRRRDS